MTAYRSILVHIDRSAQSRSRVGVGIALCRDFAAQIIGVYLDDALDIAPSIATLLPTNIVTRHISEATNAQRAAEEAFRQAAKAAGLTDVESRAPAGPPIEAAVAHGR